MEETQFASIVLLVLSVFISKRFDPAEITSLEEKKSEKKKYGRGQSIGGLF